MPNPYRRALDETGAASESGLLLLFERMVPQFEAPPGVSAGSMRPNRTDLG